MATPRYPAKKLNAGRGHSILIECGLVLSVIVGLGFVSFRILTEGPPATLIQNPDTRAKLDMVEANSAAGDAATAKAQ